jgi:hypothetical protein
MRSCRVRARRRMRIALMLEYQKSVNSHTPSRLRTSGRTTSSLRVESDEAATSLRTELNNATHQRRIELQETTGSALRSLLLGWVCLARRKLRVPPVGGGRDRPSRAYKQHLCMTACAIYKTTPNQETVVSKSPKKQAINAAFIPVNTAPAKSVAKPSDE